MKAAERKCRTHLLNVSYKFSDQLKEAGQKVHIGEQRKNLW